jgi:low temperature requirement protein LtrA
MHHEPVDGFRWRSHEVTRVEGFSDAVFGFAVTLLIVSLEVPHTSTELLATMRGFGAFVVTFFMLAALWYRQFVFFRRYGLEDRVTVILNLVLLFGDITAATGADHGVNGGRSRCEWADHGVKWGRSRCE